MCSGSPLAEKMISLFFMKKQSKKKALTRRGLLFLNTWQHKTTKSDKAFRASGETKKKSAYNFHSDWCTDTRPCALSRGADFLKAFSVHSSSANDFIYSQKILRESISKRDLLLKLVPFERPRNSSSVCSVIRVQKNVH